MTLELTDATGAPYVSPESAGDRIAAEFSADKVHLSLAEQRFLARLIDREIEQRLQFSEAQRREPFYRKSK